MAYTKTTWQNNVTDIDANNLNKIEQGIYDNSLVVDAVTNTLNPTDTETYKTAELIEGQITDVIGISDILIKGQTSQNGEPTPSAPVDVNVVSGSNVINTSNKNLFIPTLKADGTSIFVSNATVSLIKDEYTFIASGYDMYFGNVFSNGNTYNGTQGFLMTIPTNATNIYIKLTNTAFSKNYINFYDENKISLGYVSFGATGNIAVVENAKYCTLRIGVENSVSGTTYKTKVMVSTMDKAYVPHQGKELPLDLPVENLFNPTLTSQTLSSGTIITKNSDNSYTMSEGSSTADLIILGTINVKEGEIYYLSDQRVGGANNISLRRGGSVLVSTEINSIVEYTSTATETLNVYARYQSTADLIYKPMISTEYSKIYTPYGTEPIELCKIGNYQDYFYKSGSKWYLHKEIGKTIINGSEAGWASPSNNRFNLDNFNIKYKKQVGAILHICNKYKVYNQTLSNGEFNNLVQNVDYGFNLSTYIPSSGTAYTARFKDTRFTNVTDFKTWLASNNIILYCVLETVTNTEITDTTLTFQLEAIHNAPLYEQTNITQTNNDLPMVLDITACKDNINGIKAFIRK